MEIGDGFFSSISNSSFLLSKSKAEVKPKWTKQRWRIYTSQNNNAKATIMRPTLAHVTLGILQATRPKQH